jgi:CRISPR/Cas system-associated endonuclease/helicase Cas3
MASMLHHSRYADVDRQYLDQKVLGIIGLKGQRRGIAIVSTQTCEQSLDIDADLLVTDAVPADVLLQRVGRLHRHRTGTVPTVVLLEPGDWDERIREAVNEWIRGNKTADGLIDFDKLLEDPKNPKHINPVDCGDHLHPNDAGYQAWPRPSI